MKFEINDLKSCFSKFICLFYSIVILIDIREAETTSCNGILDSSKNFCYIDESSARIWQEAELMCQSIGGHLVSVQSLSDQTTLQSVLQALNIVSDVWLGGHLEQTNTPSYRLWRWISDCLHCGRDVDAYLAVSAQGCYEDETTVHDLPYAISNLEKTLTPSACIESCRDFGFWFAGVQNGSECFCGNSFGTYGPIDSKVDSGNCVVSCTGDSLQRCGGYDLNFIYYVLGGFAEWGYGKPNDFGGYQTCAVLSQSVSYKFNDAECGTSTAGYICDIPMSRCENGTIELNGTCYLITVNESLTWFEARQVCLNRGGDLIKIKNEAELNLLKSSNLLNDTQYWIGLVGLVWYWTNGDDLTYSNWYRTGDSSQWQPNNPDNECIVISPQNNYQWKDCNCNQLNSYLCQIYPDTTIGSSIVTSSIQANVTQFSSPNVAVPDVAKSSESNGRSSLTGVEIALITVAVVLFFITIVVIIIYCCCCHRCSESHNKQLHDNEQIIDGDKVYNNESRFFTNKVWPHDERIDDATTRHHHHHHHPTTTTTTSSSVDGSNKIVSSANKTQLSLDDGQVLNGTLQLQLKVKRSS